MSAVQLLEKLGADASLNKSAAFHSEMLAVAMEKEAENIPGKYWCLMFPEDEGEKEPGDDEEEISQIDINQH